MQPELTDLIGYSASFRTVLAEARRLGRANCRVLITGETGVGKGLIARRIHENSPRCSGPFVAIDCTGLTATLAASERFEQNAGVSLDATARGHGLLAATDGGTLFLDEVGDLPLATQAALVRLLPDGTSGLLGAAGPEHADVRIIAATDCDLSERVRARLFRADLYNRLNVATIHVPPLRQRRDDIPFLAAYFLRHYEPAGRALTFSLPTMSALFYHDWPGNVRELQNCVLRGAMAASTIIRPGDLGLGQGVAPPVENGRPTPAFRELVRNGAKHALTLAEGSVARAATMLKISTVTLEALLLRHRWFE
jgi:DNA-binding NtrC family response regulator